MSSSVATVQVLHIAILQYQYIYFIFIEIAGETFMIARSLFTNSLKPH